MYPLTPLRTYALDRVYDDARCVARMERILNAIGVKPGEVRRITEQNLPDVVADLAVLWPPVAVPPGQVRSFMRPLVFTTMDLDYDRRDLTPMLQRCAPGTPDGMVRNIFGHLTTAIDQHPHHLDQRHDCVCWPTYNFGTMSGCPHGCLYCGAGREGKFITVALNLEEYMDKVVKPVIEANPWNRVFRMILNGADLMTFEPEYGLHALFSQVLAQYEDRWGHFHTGSSNVDWLADLPHRDRLVGVWSVTCEAVARDIEPGTGRAIDRIEAARRCQALGIPVRFKFKPVIPVRNWRDEYAWIIEQMFKRTKPESVGFCLYVWNSYESLITSINPDLLDPEYLEAARNAQEEMKGVRAGPFPHEARKEIYRFLIREVRRWDPDVLLYVSTESREMWDELKTELGQDPRSYICGCSSVAVPGRRLAISPGFRYSTYNPTPV
jgi:DNA repair photolyase